MLNSPYTFLVFYLYFTPLPNLCGWICCIESTRRARIAYRGSVRPVGVLRCCHCRPASRGKGSAQTQCVQVMFLLASAQVCKRSVGPTRIARLTHRATTTAPGGLRVLCFFSIGPRRRQRTVRVLFLPFSSLVLPPAACASAVFRTNDEMMS